MVLIVRLVVITTKTSMLLLRKFFFFSRGPPFWIRKFTTGPQILDHVNTACPADWYPKLEMCISELNSDSY